MRRRAFLQTGLAATATAAGSALPGLGPVAARAGGLAGRWTRREQDPTLRLNSNENALGPSESARRAILDGLGESNRYTHPIVAELLPELARHHQVHQQSVVLGNGSTEVLRMAVAAMVGSAGRVVVADPTFEHVERYAAPFGLDVVKVPLTPDFAHDLDRMRDATREAPGPVLVYICNPNNPTGSLTPSGDVESWIRDARDTVVFLVDEAYAEYVGHPGYRSALPLALERPNTLVVRTFSKIYGLAGLRVGYGLAHSELARRIGAFTGFSNLNQMGLRAARACLEDEPWLDRSLAANEAARTITYRLLDELGVERIPSHTNFVMHRVPGDVAVYARRMRTLGVRVGRPFPPMTGYNRLSFGLPEEMERFGEMLRSARRNAWV
jgi:histidinol-phosphate aminotransferase